MNAILAPLLKHWPATALIASAAMLAAAHAFEAMGYAPCTLCLRQREVHWAVIAIAAAALVVGRTPLGPRSARAFDVLLALAFAASAAAALYHSGVEWKWWPGPAECAAAGGPVTAGDMAALLAGEKIRPPACDEPNWFFLGLTMANWNALISLGLAGFGAAAFSRRGGA